jgi:hypothetical protein
VTNLIEDPTIAAAVKAVAQNSSMGRTIGDGSTTMFTTVQCTAAYNSGTNQVEEILSSQNRLQTVATGATGEMQDVTASGAAVSLSGTVNTDTNIVSINGKTQDVSQGFIPTTRWAVTSGGNFPNKAMEIKAGTASFSADAVYTTDSSGLAPTIMTGTGSIPAAMASAMVCYDPPSGNMKPCQGQAGSSGYLVLDIYNNPKVDDGFEVVNKSEGKKTAASTQQKASGEVEPGAKATVSEKVVVSDNHFAKKGESTSDQKVTPGKSKDDGAVAKRVAEVRSLAASVPKLMPSVAKAANKPT